MVRILQSCIDVRAVPYLLHYATFSEQSLSDLSGAVQSSANLTHSAVLCILSHLISSPHSLHLITAHDTSTTNHIASQLLFKDGKPRWERLQSLLEEAGTTNDYDVALAVDQLLAYLVSDKGTSVRNILSVQLVEILDTLGADAADFALSFASVTAKGQVGIIPLGPVFRQGQKQGESFNLNALSEALLKAATPAAQAAKPSPALVDAYNTLRILRGSEGLSTLR